MDCSILEALHLDTEKLEAAFGAHMGIYLKYLYRFPNDHTCQELCDAVRKRDLSQIQRAAHAFKGVCATLQLGKLSELAREMDQLAKAGNLQDIEKEIPGMLMEYNEVISCIQRYSEGGYQ